MEYLMALSIFVVVVLIIEGFFLLSRIKWNPETKRVKIQLRQMKAETFYNGDVDMVRQRLLSDIPWFNRMLLTVRLPVVNKIERLLVQGNVNYSVGVIFLATFTFAIVGFAAAIFITKLFLFWITAAIVLGAIPIFYLILRKQDRKSVV